MQGRDRRCCSRPCALASSAYSLRALLSSCVRFPLTNGRAYVHPRSARLACGHIFCQVCLEGWLSTTFTQHANAHPDPPELAELHNALAIPGLDEPMRRHLQVTVDAYEAGWQRPQYTCPSCRDPILTRPTKELCVIASIVGEIVKLPVNDVGMEERPPRRDDSIWDRFFR